MAGLTAFPLDMWSWFHLFGPTILTVGIYLLLKYTVLGGTSVTRTERWLQDRTSNHLSTTVITVLCLVMAWEAVVDEVCGRYYNIQTIFGVPFGDPRGGEFIDMGLGVLGIGIGAILIIELFQGRS